MGYSEAITIIDKNIAMFCIETIIRSWTNTGNSVIIKQFLAVRTVTLSVTNASTFTI